MTGRDLISACLRLIGAAAPGEPIAADEARDGLASINRMLSSWSNEGLIVWKWEREAFSLTSGTQDYTFGTGGTLNSVRPVKILKALVRDESSSTPLEYPIIQASLDEWTRVCAKEVSGPYPSYFYDDGGYPRRTISLYPKPSSSSHKLVLYTEKPLTSITTLDTELEMPPGYEEALIYNGAMRLAPEYGRGVSAEAANIAVESKANLKRANSRATFLRVDPALQACGRFNILTGGYHE